MLSDHFVVKDRSQFKSLLTHSSPPFLICEGCAVSAAHNRGMFLQSAIRHLLFCTVLKVTNRRWKKIVTWEISLSLVKKNASSWPIITSELPSYQTVVGDISIRLTLCISIFLQVSMISIDVLYHWESRGNHDEGATLCDGVLCTKHESAQKWIL